MRILVLGADGYLGWPTAMALSAAGHAVTCVDNFLKRRLALECDAPALFDVPPLAERARLWHATSGRTLDVVIGNLLDWPFVDRLFAGERYDAVVHYAEQPSAPYSMRDRDAAALTLRNNLGSTFNVVQAVMQHQPDCHIIKLGTMGEYGTPDIDIEEGWIDIAHNGRSDRFLYPRQAGSLYHTTKIFDTDLLWFYVRMAGLRVTDLMQGPVYGMETDETAGDPSLFPSFSYDATFGTVLNRFLVQAVAGHPLTVYGKGGQTRGYLDLRDTLQCVALAIDTPAAAGELRIFNQFVETFSVNDLAARVARVGAARGLNVRIASVPNPRKELEDHYYNPAHTGLAALGLKPHPLTDDVIDRALGIVTTGADRIRPDLFLVAAK